MNPSFRVLKILSVVLKVLAWIFLVLMGTTVVALAMSKEMMPAVRAQGMATAFLQGVVLFAGFYAFGDVIRLVLTIAERVAPREQ